MIAEIVEEVLTAMAGRALQSLEDVLEIDREARAVAEQIVQRRG